MQVSVTTLSTEVVSVNVDSNGGTVGSVKKALSNRLCIPVGQMTLVFAGKVLQSAAQLCTLGINQGAHLELRVVSKNPTRRWTKYHNEPLHSQMMKAIHQVRFEGISFVDAGAAHQIPARTLRRYVRTSQTRKDSKFYLPEPRSTVSHCVVSPPILGPDFRTLPWGLAVRTPASPAFAPTTSRFVVPHLPRSSATMAPVKRSRSPTSSPVSVAQKAPRLENVCFLRAVPPPLRINGLEDTTPNEFGLAPLLPSPISPGFGDAFDDSAVDDCAWAFDELFDDADRLLA